MKVYNWHTSNIPGPCNKLIHIYTTAQLSQGNDGAIKKQVHLTHTMTIIYYTHIAYFNYWQEPNTGKYNSTIGSCSKRKRCGLCKGCLAKDCMICKFCRDKKKYGGPGKLKQCCEKKKCIAHAPESKSKLPKIFQKSISTIPSKLLPRLICFVVYCYYYAGTEPASIKDIPPKKQSDTVTHEEFVKVHAYMYT